MSLSPARPSGHQPEVESRLYAPSSSAAPTQVPHSVAAKPANSSKRTGLKRSGASRPGNDGANMIAVICGTIVHMRLSVTPIHSMMHVDTDGCGMMIADLFVEAEAEKARDVAHEQLSLLHVQRTGCDAVP